jgi:hypothetical protein
VPSVVSARRCDYGNMPWLGPLILANSAVPRVCGTCRPPGIRAHRAGATFVRQPMDPSPLTRPVQIGRSQSTGGNRTVRVDLPQRTHLNPPARLAAPQSTRPDRVAAASLSRVPQSGARGASSVRVPAGVRVRRCDFGAPIRCTRVRLYCVKQSHPLISSQSHELGAIPRRHFDRGPSVHFDRDDRHDIYPTRIEIFCVPLIFWAAALTQWIQRISQSHSFFSARSKRQLRFREAFFAHTATVRALIGSQLPRRPLSFSL